mmetsp:Transcript_70389/g.198652  ORF Transcript_70389/g.198652 Transcript_70389/m.198652 type:complete len:382 (-) Transcript_70389:206-1351(-)
MRATHSPCKSSSFLLLYAWSPTTGRPQWVHTCVFCLRAFCSSPIPGDVPRSHSSSERTPGAGAFAGISSRQEKDFLLPPSASLPSAGAAKRLLYSSSVSRRSFAILPACSLSNWSCSLRWDFSLASHWARPVAARSFAIFSLSAFSGWIPRAQSTILRLPTICSLTLNDVYGLASSLTCLPTVQLTPWPPLVGPLTECLSCGLASSVFGCSLRSHEPSSKIWKLSSPLYPTGTSNQWNWPSHLISCLDAQLSQVPTMKYLGDVDTCGSSVVLQISGAVAAELSEGVQVASAHVSGAVFRSGSGFALDELLEEVSSSSSSTPAASSAALLPAGSAVDGHSDGAFSSRPGSSAATVVALTSRSLPRKAMLTQPACGPWPETLS